MIFFNKKLFITPPYNLIPIVEYPINDYTPWTKGTNWALARPIDSVSNYRVIINPLYVNIAKE